MDGRNDEQNNNEHADTALLEQQMRDLLRQIEEDPVPRELHTLAEKLQTALRRRDGS